MSDRLEAEDSIPRDHGVPEGEGRRRRALHRELLERHAALRPRITEKQALVFTEVDLLKDKNRTEHQTDQYDEPALIVRRGQVFSIAIGFERDYKPGQDKITLQFTTGPKPQAGKGTLIQVPVTKDLKTDSSKWSAGILENSGKRVRIQFFSPADAVVGEYKIYVETKSVVGGEQKVHKSLVMDDKEKAIPIYILFNVFCKDDICYMENKGEQEEYVMNDTGKIWVGSQRYPHGRPWNFGQFDGDILLTALYLMDRAKLPAASRSSPVHVTRCLSKMVNNLDGDNGVLVGRWGADYPGGTSPGEWNGSVAILEEYWKNKKPVKYGQCWVFSGLVTTLCRALGLPTRSVTNFASAHDTDQSNTIDNHFDEEGKEYMGGRYDDSVWNFHVWNESWFNRHDLPAGNDGWQAHDATPQESSEGYYQCGPAPVAAVKRGDVYLRYDAGFVFGEVNGDRISWTVKKDGDIVPSHISKFSVGKKISTKSVQSNYKREDITHTYKYTEGSEDERRAVRKAHSYGSRKEIEVYKPLADDVTFQEHFPESVPIGSDVTAEVALHNTSTETRSVKVTFTSSVIYYTGVPTMDSDVASFDVVLKPNEESRLAHTIKASDYMGHMVSGGSMRVHAVGHVKETKQSAYLMDVIEFEKPDIEIKSNDVAKAGEDFTFSMSFKNPLTTKLTNGKFSYEGNNILPRNGGFKLKDSVAPGGNAQASFKVQLPPRKRRKVTIVGNFTSRELTDVTGSMEVTTE